MPTHSRVLGCLRTTLRALAARVHAAVVVAAGSVAAWAGLAQATGVGTQGLARVEESNVPGERPDPYQREGRSETPPPAGIRRSAQPVRPITPAP